MNQGWGVRRRSARSLHSLLQHPLDIRTCAYLSSRSMRLLLPLRPTATVEVWSRSGIPDAGAPEEATGLPTTPGDPMLPLLLSSMSFLCSSLSSKLRWRDAASTGVVGDGRPMIGESCDEAEEVVAGPVMGGPAEACSLNVGLQLCLAGTRRCCCWVRAPPLPSAAVVDMAMRSSRGSDSARGGMSGCDGDEEDGSLRFSASSAERAEGPQASDADDGCCSPSNEASRTALRARRDRGGGRSAREGEATSTKVRCVRVHRLAFNGEGYARGMLMADWLIC